MSRSRLLVALSLVLAGCGGGSYDPPPSDGAAGDGLIALDLATGQFVAMPAGTTPQGTQLLFRRIAAGTAALHTGDGLTAAGSQDATANRSVSSFAIGLHEVTRAQWEQLARFSAGDAAPWDAVTPSGLAGDAGDTHPACGLSHTLIQRVLTAWNADGRVHLRLPTTAEWEFAAGSAGTAFGWGDATDTGTVGTYARVRETRSGTAGPGPCGALQAPGVSGLYDMHGNVWEWVAEQHLRGGSWLDGMRSAASGNRLTVDRDTPYATAGVRLVLESLP